LLSFSRFGTGSEWWISSRMNCTHEFFVRMDCMIICCHCSSSSNASWHLLCRAHKVLSTSEGLTMGDPGLKSTAEGHPPLKVSHRESRMHNTENREGKDHM
jgi:hypothetical protein